MFRRPHSKFNLRAGVRKRHQRDSSRRIRRCVAKYTEPLELDAWDVGLLRHYRAERASEAETGRALIERAKGSARFLTVTGDVDRIVPASATGTVAELLGADARTIADTGHLPLDERPQEVADVLLEFISS